MKSGIGLSKIRIEALEITAMGYVDGPCPHRIAYDSDT